MRQGGSEDVERVCVEDSERIASPLVIDYSQVHSVSVDPADRSGFLDTLRQYAPLANFEL